MIRTFIALSATLILAACGPGQQRQRIPAHIIDRALAGAPGEAQPGTIVATESAFARMAREEGQWTAFAAFAAPKAVLHGAGGTIDAASWLSTQQDPEQSVQWGPRAIWMSCDGSLAASEGRFRDPSGVVGTFVTIWQRNDERDYRWIYDAGTPDNPQPPPRKSQDPADDGDIVVTALDAVQGRVADCPRRGEGVPTAPAVPIVDEVQSGGGISPDGTLQWRWEHQANGDRRVVVNFLQGGEWVTGLDRAMPAQRPTQTGQ